jgi:type II secretory pathway pseudopilin PulG
MMNTCFYSIPIETAGFASASHRYDRDATRYQGFSLPEAMIALLLVSLSASVLISTAVTTRTQMASNARLSAVFRLAVELSDWVRQGGMKALASDTINPFALLDQQSTVASCFGSPCHAQAAALFYLQSWRRRLFLKVPNARIVVCQDNVSISPSSHHWSCDSGNSSFKVQVIKIGWPQGGDGEKFPPRVVLALG